MSIKIFGQNLKRGARERRDEGIVCRSVYLIFWGGDLRLPENSQTLSDPADKREGKNILPPRVREVVRTEAACAWGRR
jgi:hypothetical protein